MLFCVTVALTGNVAHIAHDIPPAYANQHVALVRPKQPTIVPRFFACSLHSTFGKYQFKLAEYGGTKQGLSLSDVASALDMLPDRATQQSVVEHLDRSSLTANHTIASVLREIDLIREYRTRLVADVVTGKVDVRAAAAAIPDEAQGPGGAHERSDDPTSEDDAADEGTTSNPRRKGPQATERTRHKPRSLPRPRKLRPPSREDPRPVRRGAPGLRGAASPRGGGNG